MHRYFEKLTRRKNTINIDQPLAYQPDEKLNFKAILQIAIFRCLYYSSNFIPISENPFFWIILVNHKQLKVISDTVYIKNIYKNR